VLRETPVLRARERQEWRRQQTIAGLKRRVSFTGRRHHLAAWRSVEL